MKKVMRSKKISIGLTLIGPLLLFAFNNCSSRHELMQTASSQVATVQNSLCESQIIADYGKTVAPFVQANCKECHVPGGVGLGQFADSDLTLAYQAFQATGLSKVSYMATNPGHKQPNTGPQNKNSVDSLNVTWPKAEDNYLNCLASSGNSEDLESFLTAAKPAPLIYAKTGNPVQDLSWDLDIAGDVDATMNRAVPVKVLLSVKTYILNGKVQGYVFSNPRIQVKDQKAQILTEALYIYINKKLVASQTTFVPISKISVFNKVSNVPQSLMDGNAVTLVDPVSTGDVFSLYFRRMTPTSEASDTQIPIAPVLRLTDVNGVKGTQFISAGSPPTAQITITRDYSAIRWCLSTSPTAPANTEAVCVGGVGPVNGWYLTRPTTMNIPGADGPRTYYLWVANSGLVINTSALPVAITLDTQSPVAAKVFAGTVKTGLPLGNLTIQNPTGTAAWDTDVTGYCIIDTAAAVNQGVAPARPFYGDSCWRWDLENEKAKPNTVGFNGGGTRYVYVFVRDAAGNISPASNFVQYSNPVGAVTFSMLTGAASSQTSVLTNNCAVCHQGTNAPGFQQVRLFEYQDIKRVASDGDGSVIVSRTNNKLAPMPNTNAGLMNKDLRDIIRLWVSPLNEAPGAKPPL